MGCEERDPEASSGKGLSRATIAGENWAVGILMETCLDRTPVSTSCLIPLSVG